MEYELIEYLPPIANIASAALVTVLAVYNRGIRTLPGGKTLRDVVESKFGDKIGKFYNKISPTLEHFAFGYAIALTGYSTLEIAGMLNSFSPSILESTATMGGHTISGMTIGADFIWEADQAYERKKILPEQFLGTVAGALLANIQHNPQIVYNLIDLIK